VNLRLDGPGPRRLGVETHVCELQLLLMSPEVHPSPLNVPDLQLLKKFECF
jgi:hypothetical protein